MSGLKIRIFLLVRKNEITVLSLPKSPSTSFITSSSQVLQVPAGSVPPSPALSIERSSIRFLDNVWKYSHIDNPYKGCQDQVGHTCMMHLVDIGHCFPSCRDHHTTLPTQTNAMGISTQVSNGSDLWGVCEICYLLLLCWRYSHIESTARQ